MLSKIFKTKYLLLPIIIISIIMLTPFLVEARGLVPCGGEGESLCNLCFLFKLLENVMSFLVNTVGVVATLFLVVGGIVLVVSGANKSLYETGKKIITNTIIGTAIVIIAWIGINTILTIAGFSRANIGLSGNWFELQCSTAPGLIIPPGEIPPGEIPPGEIPFSCLLPCNNPRFNPGIRNWTELECNAAISVASTSTEEKALIKAITWKENGANAGVVDTKKTSKKHACGPTQITPIAMRDIDPARFNDNFTYVDLKGDPAICEYLQDNPAEAVGWTMKILKKIQRLALEQKQNNGYDMSILELTAGGYNAGYPRNDQVSQQCGPGKPCNEKPDAQFKAPVPVWKCSYDTGCVPNTGFKETRNYVPDVINGYNYFLTSCSN